MSNYKSHTDAQLLDCIKSGDETAFAEVYNRYGKLMYLHALKMLQDEDEAKDLVQELFVALWSKAGNIAYNTNLSGYLYVSARNKVLNLIQQKKVRRDYISSLGVFVEETRNTTLEQISEKELRAVIEHEIQKLPEKMRNVFELSRKANLSHKEIASQLEISDKTVKKQINYALRIIKFRLNTLTRMLMFLMGI